MANWISPTFGVDSLGPFRVRGGRPVQEEAKCRICGRTRVVVVQYKDTPKVSDYIAKANALLIRNKKTGTFIRTIGISCGCYAKVHRQIAHIEGAAKINKSTANKGA